LGGEQVIAAEKGDAKIAVEIKSFLRSSAISEFHDALGQYMNYLDALAHVEPNRVLYLAVPLDAYETFFLSPYGQHVVQRYQLRLIVYKTTHAEVVKWIP
jgi:XisH protein